MADIIHNGVCRPLYRKEPVAMLMSEEGKKVFRRLCLIALGIPSVLLAFCAVLHLTPWAVERVEVGPGTLNIVAGSLAAGGFAAWAFLAFYLYRRLWKLFPYIGEKEKGWSYAEGVFGLTGVGTSMASVLGMFYYLFSGDFGRAALLFGISYAMAAVEAARFPARIADIEDMMKEK